MQRRVITPDQLDFQSPGRRDYWVVLEHDSIWGQWHLPLTVFVGPQARTGRGLVAFGSNHGNEYEGPVAIKHLLRQIDISAVLGRIILIPVLNVPAFRSGTRSSDSDDRVNLNRAFVEGAGATPALGGITHRIARFVREHIWPNVNVVLDLHSGGEVARFALCASFHPLDDPKQSQLVEQTARSFGTPFVLIYQNRTPGLLVSEAERLGKITVGGEFGWGRAINPSGVKFARHGVLAAAIDHEQMRGTIEPIGHQADGTQKTVAAVRSECFVPAPWPGHYEPLMECGAKVPQGQTVGLLHDFDRLDEEPWPVQAGTDGYVLAQAWAAPVSPGQHVLVIGEEVEGD